MSNPVVGSARVVITPDSSAFASQLTAQLGSLQGPATAAGNKMSQAFSSAAATLGGIGSQLVSLGGTLTKSFTLPIGLATAGVVKFGTEFDSAIRTAATIGGIDVSIIGKNIDGMGEASAQAKEQVDLLKNAALDLGTKGRLGPVEIAEGFTELARAGILGTDVIAAATPIIDLATAEGIKFSDAAEKSINVFAGYGGQLKNNSHLAEQLTYTIDVLAQTSNMSTTSMGELTDAFRFVGPVAHGLGISFEETAAALGILANAGFKGSLGGTALRGTLTRLAIASGETAERLNTLGLSSEDALETLTKNELDNVEKQLRGIGLRGEELKKAMEQGAGGTQAAQQALSKLGVSVFQADGKMIPLNKTLNILKEHGATTADVMAIFGQRAGPGLAALLQAGGDELAAWTDQLEHSSGAAKKLAEGILSGPEGSFDRLKNTLEALAIAISESGVLAGFGEIATKLTHVVDALRKVDPGILKFVSTLALVVAAAGPVISVFGYLFKSGEQLFKLFAFLAANPFVAALAAIAGALYLAWQNSEDFRKALGKLGEVFGRILEPLSGMGDSLKEGFGAGISMVGQFGKALGDFLAGPITAFADWLDNAITQLGHLWDTLAEGEDVAQGVGEIIDNIFGNTGALVGPVRAFAQSIIDMTDAVRFFFDDISTGATLLEGFTGALMQLGVAEDTAYAIGEAIGSIADAAIDLWDRLQPVRDAFSQLGDAISKVNLAPVFDAFSRLGDALGSLDFGRIKDGFAGVVDAVKGIDFSGVTDAFSNLLTTVYNIGGELIGELLDGIKAALPGALTAAQDFAHTILGALSNALGELGLLLEGPIRTGLSTALTAAVDALDAVPIIGPLITAIRSALLNGFDAITGLVDLASLIFSGTADMATINAGLQAIGSELLTGITDVIRGIGQAVGPILDLLTGPIRTGLETALTTAVDAVANIPVVGPLVEAIKTALMTGFDSLTGLIDLASAITTGDGTKILASIKELGTTLLNGLTTMLTGLGTSISELGDIIAGPVRDWLNEQLAEALKGVDIPLVGPLVDGLAMLAGVLGPVISFIGDHLVPILVTLGAVLAGIEIVGFITAIAGFVSTIVGGVGAVISFGGAVIGFVGSIASAAALVGGFVADIVGLIATFGLADGAALALSGTIGILGSPFWLIAGAIAAVTAALVLLYTQSQAFRDAVGKAIEEVKVIFDGLVGSVMGVWDAFQKLLGGDFAGALSSLGDAAKSWFSGVVGGIAGLAGALVDGIKAAFDEVLGALGNIPVVGPIFDAIRTSVDGLFQALSSLFDVIKKLFSGDFSGAFDSLKQAFAGVWDWLYGQIVTLPTAVFNALVSIGQTVVGALGSVISGIPGVLGGWLGAIRDWVFNDLPRLLVEGFTAAIQNLSSLASIVGNAGHTLIDFLVNGAKAAITGFGDLLKDLPEIIIGAITGNNKAESGIGQWLTDALHGAFEFLKNAIPTVLATAAKVIIGGLLGALKLVFFDIPKWLVTEALPSLWNAIIEHGPDILSAIGNIMSQIPSLVFSALSGLGSIVLTVLGTIPSILLDWAGDLGGLLLDVFKAGFEWLVANGPTILATVWTWLTGLPPQFLTALGDLGGILLGWFSAAWDWLVANGPAILTTVWNFLTAVPGQVLGALGSLGEKLGEWFSAGWDWLGKNWPTLVLAAAKWLSEVKDKILGFLGSLGETLGGWFSAGWDWVKDHWTDIIKGLLIAIVAVPGAIIFALGKIGLKLVEWLTDGFNYLKDNAGSIIGGIVEFFEPTNPDGLFAKIAALIITAGPILWNGLVTAFNFVKDNILPWIGTVAEFFNPFNPDGLFQKMIALGATAGQALWDGIVVAFNFVKDNIGTWISSAASFFNPTNPDGLVQKAIALFANAGTVLWDGIVAAFNFVKDQVIPWIASVAEFFNPFNSEGLVQKAIGLFANAGSTLWNGIVAAFNFVKDNIGGWIGTAAEFFNPFNPDGIIQKAISFFSTAGSTLWNGIVSAFNFVKDKLGEWIGDAASFFNPFNPDGLLQRIIKGAANLGSDLWNNVFVPAKDWLVQKIPEMISAIVDFFKALPGKIVDAIAGLGSIAADFGKKIVNAIIDFVNNSIIGKINALDITVAGVTINFPDIPNIPRLGLGGIFDKPTLAEIGEDGTEVVIPLTKTARALELAEKSGLANMILGALNAGQITPQPGFSTAAALGNAGTPASSASSTPGVSPVLLQPNFTTPAAAAAPGGGGDTFIINGVSPEQVIAKIQAERDAAARRIRR